MAKYTENLNLETPEYTDDADIPALIEKNNNILDEIINSKANSNDVPAKLSELENDSNFITSNSDVIKSLQNKKAEIIELLNVTDTAPEICSIDDKYYNTMTNKIYTAIADNTWNEGDDPSSIFLYVDLTNSRLYYYDGTNFKSYGGGSSGDTLQAGDTLPVGSVVSYSGETAPANWLICDGSAVSRTTYADLFSVIGTTYGSGDGSTTFNLPNLKGKVITGLDSSDSDFNTIGKTGGEKTHKLTINEMPSHRHDFYIDASGTTVPAWTTRLLFKQEDSEHSAQSNNTTDTGGSQAHNNLQPYVVQNYIIKAFQSAGVVANVAQSKTTSDTDTYSCNYLNGVVVWQNENITQSFGAQTINLDLSNYKKIKVYSYRYKSVDERQIITEFNVNSTGEIIYSDCDNGVVRSWNRQITINQNSIVFGNCKINNDTSSRGLVPSKIVAYKYV